MNQHEQIASLLARFMAAETTEEEENRLAEYFRTVTDIPSEWKPYAEMFQILDEGATRLTDEELERALAPAPTVAPHASAGRSGGTRRIRLHKWAAMPLLLFCIGALAAAITYRAVVNPNTSSGNPSSPNSTRSMEGAERATAQDETSLPDTLTFNNLPLADIAQHITAIYGNKVVFADSATAALRLYFTLPKGSTASDFVTIIDEYETLAATMQDGTITIQKQ